jgi:uncharacterized LabA/DUF88 family protein
MPVQGQVKNLKLLSHFDAILQNFAQKSTQRLKIQNHSKIQPVQLRVIPARTQQNYLKLKTFGCRPTQTVLTHFAFQLFAFPTTILSCDPIIKAKLGSDSLTSVSFVKKGSPEMPSSNKIALFIDGANLYATAKTLGFDIDYKRLLKEFQSRGTLVRAFYYTAIIEDQEYSSIRPLIDWLDYNGYTVVTKATKEFIDASGRRKVKGNMDIELAVDAMELAEHVDQIVLFSGDGDFRSLVEAVQRRGVRVTVVSTISSQPPMIADELRRQADVFTDLVEIKSKIVRDPSERPAPREPRHHAPQFLQRVNTTAPGVDDDDFED